MSGNNPEAAQYINKELPQDSSDKIKLPSIRSIKRAFAFCGSIYTIIAALIVFYIYISAHENIVVSLVKPYSWGVSKERSFIDKTGGFLIQNLAKYAILPDDKPKFITCGSRIAIEPHMRIEQDYSGRIGCYFYFLDKTLLPSERIVVKTVDITRTRLFSAQESVIDRSNINYLVISMLIFIPQMTFIVVIFMLYTFVFIAVVEIYDRLVTPKYQIPYSNKFTYFIFMSIFILIMFFMFYFYLKYYHDFIQDRIVDFIRNVSMAVGNELLVSLATFY